MKTDESTALAPRAETVKQDEIQLLDVWKMLVRQKNVIFVTLVIALMAAVAFLAIAPKEWEGTAVIRIGQVGRMAPDHPQPIETIGRAIDRMKLTPVFQDDVLSSLSIPLDSSNAIFIRKHIDFEARQSDLIELKVIAHSPEEARTISDAMAKELSVTHAKMAEPGIAELKAQAAEISMELQNVLAERNRTIQALISTSRSGGEKSLGEVALMGSVAGSSQNYIIRDLQRVSLEINQQLGSTNTFPTELIQKISVSDEPVFPSKPLILVSALILGLLIGSLVACFRDYREREKVVCNAKN